MKGMYNLEKRVKGCLKRTLSVSLAVLVFLAINGTVSAQEDGTASTESGGTSARLNAVENRMTSVVENRMKTVEAGATGVAGKLEADLSNLAADDQINAEELKILKAKLAAGGAVEEDNENLVTGGAVHTAIAGKANSNAVYTKEESDKRFLKINGDIEGNKGSINTNAGNIAVNGQTIAENKKAIAKNAKDIKKLRKDDNRGISQVAAMTAIDFDVLEAGEVGIGAGAVYKFKTK